MMRRLWWMMLAVMGAVCWTLPAHASGDYMCEPDWKLSQSAMSGCDDMVMLAPGNDTRTNLLLLLNDLHGAKPVAAAVTPDPLFDWPTFRDTYYPRPAQADGAYAEGEGSRCRSNAGGSAAFLTALQSSKASEEERKALGAARTALSPDCATARAGAEGGVPGLQSDDGKAFGAYLVGIQAFYDANYDKARTQFDALKKARNGWVRETSLYMLGRVEVNRAQFDAYDEYGSRKQDMKIDLAIINAAEGGLRAYLKTYPTGLYANSARGLLRRVFWLAGDNVKLSAEYAAAFAKPLAGLDDGTLAEEVDDKLIGGMIVAQIRDPMLLAVYDLQHMRKSVDKTDTAFSSDMITAAGLDAQKGAFAGSPALFTYLQAARAWYVEGKGAEVVRLIADAARQSSFTTLEFSRQMLRGIALEANKDRNARGFWLEMLPGATLPAQRAAIELAMAQHDERAGALAKVFEAGSVVHTPSIREILLINVADAGLLRQQVKDSAAPQHERDVALFTLLYKSVSRGQYQAFVDDLALVPAGASVGNGYWSLREAEKPPFGLFTQTTSLGDYACPPLKATAAQLARNAKDSKALLCLADFMRVNAFDGSTIDVQRSADQLGGTKTLFPGKAYSRLEVYKGIMIDPAAPAADKAYALYRAVNCYGPSGNNSCGGTEVSKDVRRSWFLRLKKDYPKSRWAGELRYYW